jgi:hypothetical protein
MRYDPTNPRHIVLLRCHADLDDDACPVDDICDSIPAILDYIKILEGKIREYKSVTQKLNSDVRELERRLNNVKSQKFRILKKKKMG